MIYLDANAASQTRRCVTDGAVALLVGGKLRGNASSIHAAGRELRTYLEQARIKVAQFVSGNVGTPLEIIFTSGGTEACNTIVSGFLPRNGGHIVCSAIEHLAVGEACESERSRGRELSLVFPEKSGVVSVEAMVREVRADTVLVTLMVANNETGALQPVRELATRLRRDGYSGAIVSDATQAFGKTEFSADDLFHAGVDALALSGHKLGAFAGVGAILLSSCNKERQSCRTFSPLLRGGPQESGRRGGSENVLACWSLGAVCAELQGNLGHECKRIRQLREMLWETLSENISGIFRLTPFDCDDEVRALSNTLLLRFTGCRADDLVIGFDLAGLCASTGSACSSGKQGVSHVYRALGLSEQESREVVRFSLDWDSDEALIDRAAEIITSTVERMREVNVTPTEVSL